jgi:hypothetical protein
LKRELLFILNENAPGFVELKETLPELFAARRLKQYRDELAVFVTQALEDDRLSLDGAVNCGQILAAQLTEEDLEARFTKWTQRIFQDGPSGKSERKLAALAWLPVEVFDPKKLDAVLTLAKSTLEGNQTVPRGLPGFVLKTFEKAVLEEKTAAGGVMGFLPGWMSKAGDEMFMEMAFACKDTLQKRRRRRRTRTKRSGLRRLSRR